MGLLQSIPGVHAGAGGLGEDSSQGEHDLGGSAEAKQGLLNMETVDKRETDSRPLPGLCHQHQPQELAEHVGAAVPGQRWHGRLPHLGPAPASRPLQRHRGQGGRRLHQQGGTQVLLREVCWTQWS